ncbi:hypothetical protein, partial [uncultured Salegentibacter sp.]|uniref:hypothetical protein n=1 Tax=uncultured Salegentibacter sp. TaxID=259320 RepID=UPI0030DA74B6
IKGGKDGLATGGIANHFRERVGLKPGGIVEPGVTHYAKKERSLSLDKKIGQIISKYGKEARGISAEDLKKLVMTIYNSSSRFIDSKSTKGIKNYLPGLLEGFVEEDEIAKILNQEKKSFYHKNHKWKGGKDITQEKITAELKQMDETILKDDIPKKKRPSAIISEKLDPFRVKGDIVAIKKGLKIDTHHSIKKALLNPDIPGIHFKAETLETLYPVKDALNRGQAGGFANSVMNIAETELEKIAKARNALIDETGRIIKGKENEFARLQAKGTKIVRNYSKAQELFEVPYKASGAPGKASGAKNIKGVLNFEVFTPGDDGVLKGKLIGGHPKKSYAGQILGDPLAVKPFAEYTVADIEKAKKTLEAKINKFLNVEDSSKLSSTIQSILNKKNSGLNIADIAKWGSAELSALDNIAGKLPSKALSVLGKLLKTAGIAAIPLDLIPYTQEINRGMAIRSVDTGTARLLEDFANMPKFVVQLAGMLLKKDLDVPWGEATFGRRYADWVAEGIPLEQRIKN